MHAPSAGVGKDDKGKKDGGPVAIYHASVKIVSRSAGRSAVASAAYRSAERIPDRRTGQDHDYTRKEGVVHSEIMAPDNAPAWMRDRAELWNGVEAAEKRKDSQLAREIEVALPRELSRAQQVALVRSFVQERCVAHGMVADIAIHEPKASDGERQPHAHVMLTMRGIEGDGFGKKATEWNPEFGKAEGRAFVADKSPLADLREAWGEHVNAALERAQRPERVDHRSLDAQRVEAQRLAVDPQRPEPERAAAERRAQDLDREPQPKLGAAAAGLERQGVQTDRGDQWRAAQARNAERLGLWQQVREWGHLVRERAHQVADQVREKAREAAERLKAAGERLAETVAPAGASWADLEAAADRITERDRGWAALSKAADKLAERDQSQARQKAQEARKAPERGQGPQQGQKGPTEQEIQERMRQMDGRSPGGGRGPSRGGWDRDR